MKKIDLNAKLSKKNTVIAIAAVIIFALAGIVGAAVGGKAYIDGQKAEITNASHSSADSFHVRSDGANLVYVYDDSVTSVDLTEIIKISDKATMTVVAVLDGNGTKTSTVSAVLDVKDSQRYFVIINVKSNGGAKTNGYLIEVVAKSDYTETVPDILNGNFSQYIISAK